MPEGKLLQKESLLTVNKKPTIPSSLILKKNGWISRILRDM